MYGLIKLCTRRAVAEEVWERHKKRNDSIIVDLFYGLLRLTIVCPVCSYTFRAFDPFASLSLPLDVVLINALIWSSNDEFQRIWCTIYVPPRCSLENLLSYFNLARQPNDGCQYAIIKRDGLYLRILEPKDTLNFLKQGNILMAFEVPFVQGSTNTVTSNSKNGSVSDTFEILCDGILTVINSHLSNAGVKEQAIVAEYCSVPQIRVPSAFSYLTHTDELHQKLDLDLCFQLFTTKETFSTQSPWNCKKCKEPRQASKKLEIWRLPEVLIIHLKRFRTMFPMEKINKFVGFPEE
ncbi:unnamed protein product [Dibothriocephalus latus]|uniref:ubiquitinyl hydrolase 1 n=1 Tax=Dibothriocephalus latus TaxID=60516 RepID=A0A3P7NTT4_DIBLA|nr:unnamed protein product [Dibothriocephalus latus]